MKYRFVVKQNNVEKSVFTISESPSGDLQINYSLPKSFLITDNRSVRVNRRSMTVHTSVNSYPPVRTITNKLFLNGTLLTKDFGVFMLPEHKHYIWPVSCDLIGSHIPDIISKKLRKDEELVRLAAYSSKSETMFMAILIGDPEYRLPEASGLSFYRLAFQEFSLTLLYNFGDIPTPKGGFFTFLKTSASLLPSSVRIIGAKPRAHETFSEEDIEPTLLDRFYMLSAMAQFDLSSRFLITPKQRYVQFRRYPNKLSEMKMTDLVYGVNSIVGSTRHTPGTRINPKHQKDKRFSSDQAWSSFDYDS